MIFIARWDNGEVIHSGDFDFIKDCLEDGVRKEVNFYRANLRGVDLTGVNLEGADLQEADLEGAYLRRANLIGTNLEGADLSEADLTMADLSEANLIGASLQYIEIRGTTGDNLYIKNTPKEILDDLPYKVVYTKYKLQIGCQGMSIFERLDLDDDDLTYLKNKYKDIILSYIKNNPAKG